MPRMIRDDDFPEPNASTEKASRKPAPDWERIELDYRAGVRSLREIAAEHGISEGAIRKRAKRFGWERDLSAKIQAKADDLVRKEAVRTEVRADSTTEREIVDANAQAIMQVRLAHRRDIQRTRTVVMTMMAELEASCTAETVEMLVSLGEMMRNEDEHGRDKLNDLYQAIVSLPGRAKTMKDLAASLATLIDKEREAYSIGAKVAADGGDAPVAGKTLTDAERAVRLSRLLTGNPDALSALLSRIKPNA